MFLFYFCRFSSLRVFVQWNQSPQNPRDHTQGCLRTCCRGLQCPPAAYKLLPLQLTAPPCVHVCMSRLAALISERTTQSFAHFRLPVTGHFFTFFSFIFFPLLTHNKSLNWHAAKLPAWCNETRLTMRWPEGLLLKTNHNYSLFVPAYLRRHPSCTSQLLWRVTHSPRRASRSHHNQLISLYESFYVVLPSSLTFYYESQREASPDVWIKAGREWHWQAGGWKLIAATVFHVLNLFW